MMISINKRDVLHRIKLAYKLNSDVELAAMLDIPSTTLSSWKTRNSIDWDRIFTKCEGISFDYLIYGSGDIFVANEVEKETIDIDSPAIIKLVGVLVDKHHQQIIELSEKLNKAENEKSELMKEYKDKSENSGKGQS